MRGALTRLGLLVVFALSCREETPLPAPPAPPLAEPTKRPAPPPTPYSVPAQQGEVVGHLRIGDPAALLAKLETVLPASFVDQLQPDALRRRLSVGATPVVADVVAHIDLQRPTGCVLLDPAARTQPYACVFGYTGGLTQLVEDLGPQGRIDDSQAALHLERDAAHWYFDALGEDIVFAPTGDGYEACRAYLDALRNPGATRDVEVVLHTAHAVETYRSELAGLLVAASVAARADVDDDNGGGLLDQARDQISGLEPEYTERALDALDELAGIARETERVELYAAVDDESITLGMLAQPVSGTAFAGWAQAAPSLPADVWNWLPHGTWLVSAARQHPRGTIRPDWDALLWRVFARYLARFVERPMDDVLAAGESMATAREQAYGDWWLLAAFNSPATRGGLMLVRPLLPGADARTPWLELARAATPRSLFGDALGATVESTVQWSVVANAKTVEGLTVDEWRLIAAPGLLDRLDASLADGEIGKEIIAALRGRESLLAVQRFELDSAVVFTVAPGGGAAYVAKVIGAHKGDGRLDRAGIDTITAHQHATQRIAGLSAFDLLQAIEEALPTEARAGIPATAGRNLSDAHFATHTTEGGAIVHELRVSAFVLEALRDALSPD